MLHVLLIIYQTDITDISHMIMKGTKVQTLGACAWCMAVAWAITIIMAMAAIINTHAHR